MQKKLFINGAASCAAQKEELAVELFLHDNYLFRRNMLNGKVEFATRNDADGNASEYRPLTQEALNSIILCAKRENLFD